MHAHEIPMSSLNLTILTRPDQTKLDQTRPDELANLGSSLQLRSLTYLETIIGSMVTSILYLNREIQIRHKHDRSSRTISPSLQASSLLLLRTIYITQILSFQSLGLAIYLCFDCTCGTLLLMFSLHSIIVYILNSFFLTSMLLLLFLVCSQY